MNYIEKINKAYNKVILLEGNPVSHNLPPEVDTILQDLSQEGFISYKSIFNADKILSPEDISYLISLYNKISKDSGLITDYIDEEENKIIDSKLQEIVDKLKD